MAAAIAQDDTSVLGRAAMIAGEVFIPGASELVAGNIGSGVASFLVAGAAAVFLGPTLPVVAALVGIGVRVNSYQDATTGMTLYSSARQGVEKISRARRSKSKQHVESEEPAKSN